MLQKTPYVFPIIGQRKVEHLLANIEALKVEMTPEDLDQIDCAVPFDPGFPTNFLFDGKYDLTLTAADAWHAKLAGRIESPAHQQAIKPHRD